MATLREFAAKYRIALQTGQRYAGPPLLICAVEDKEVVVHTKEERDALNDTQTDEVTATVQLDRKALQEQLGEYGGSVSSLSELIAPECHILPLSEELQALTEGVRIGRDPESDLLLDNQAVSARHAILSWRSGRWYVRDVGSSNGTYVNKRQLEPNEEMALVNGDCLRFGDSVLYLLSGGHLAYLLQDVLNPAD